MDGRITGHNETKNILAYWMNKLMNTVEATHIQDNITAQMYVQTFLPYTNEKKNKCEFTQAVFFTDHAK